METLCTSGYLSYSTTIYCLKRKLWYPLKIVSINNEIFFIIRSFRYAAPHCIINYIYYIHIEIYSPNFHTVNFRSFIAFRQPQSAYRHFTCEKNDTSNQEPRITFVTCEKIDTSNQKLQQSFENFCPCKTKTWSGPAVHSWIKSAAQFMKVAQDYNVRFTEENWNKNIKTKPWPWNHSTRL